MPHIGEPFFLSKIHQGEAPTGVMQVIFTVPPNHLLKIDIMSILGIVGTVNTLYIGIGLRSHPMRIWFPNNISAGTIVIYGGNPFWLGEGEVVAGFSSSWTAAEDAELNMSGRLWIRDR